MKNLAAARRQDSVADSFCAPGEKESAILSRCTTAGAANALRHRKLEPSPAGFQAPRMALRLAGGRELPRPLVHRIFGSLAVHDLAACMWSRNPVTVARSSIVNVTFSTATW